MESVKKAAFVVTGSRRARSVGTVHVVDSSPMNWLWITFNTVEELVRVAPSDLVEPAAMTAYRWADDTTLEVGLGSGTTCEVTGDFGIRLRPPRAGGGVVAKLRAIHVMRTRVWGEVGFGYAWIGSGEVRW